MKLPIVIILASVLTTGFISNDMLQRDLEKVKQFYANQEQYHFGYTQKVYQNGLEVSEMSIDGEFLKYNDLWFLQSGEVVNLMDNHKDLVVNHDQKTMYLREYESVDRPISIPGSELLQPLLRSLDSSKMKLPDLYHTKYTCYAKSAGLDSVELTLNNKGFYKQINLFTSLASNTQTQLQFEPVGKRIKTKKRVYQFSHYLQPQPDGSYLPSKEYTHYTINTLKI